YISEFASLLLQHNRSSFIEYLSKEVTRKGNNKLEFKNFLCSLYSRNVKSFEITNPKNQKCFQFFLSKEDIEFFGIKQELFNYQEASLLNYKKENNLNTLLNKNLNHKNHRVSLIHHGRKSMFFNNLILNLSEITEEEQNQFLLNYFNVHKQFIDELDRKSTRLNSSHVKISYAVFCLKKKIYSDDHGYGSNVL